MTSLEELISAMGSAGVYKVGAGDGTASYGSQTQLTLTDMPTVPLAGQFIGTLMYDSGPLVGFPAWLFAHSCSGDTLTVTNASFSATATYVVLYYGQVKGYDSTNTRYKISASIPT